MKKIKNSGGRRPGAGRHPKYGKGVKTDTISFNVPAEKKNIIKEKVTPLVEEISRACLGEGT